MCRLYMVYCPGGKTNIDFIFFNSNIIGLFFEIQEEESCLFFFYIYYFWQLSLFLKSVIRDDK
jgi:hypothetical protein